MNAFQNHYANKRVLITGHTGFKGSWLAIWLKKLGAKVAGFSLNVPTSPSHFEVFNLQSQITHFSGDIRIRSEVAHAIKQFEPEIVFHLAAQSLVRASFEHPLHTFETNVLGTLNVLESLRLHPCAQSCVIITSDKCYKNVEWNWGYREIDALGGDDPYSASKACAEIATQSYIQSFLSKTNVHVSTTRAGNVIGGGDWAADRLVPDCMRAFGYGQAVTIRKPGATRPWQHVLEPLSGYLWLGVQQILQKELAGEAFNFGPSSLDSHSVETVVGRMIDLWPGNKMLVERSPDDDRECTLLKLSCDKANALLKWHSAMSFDQTLGFTVDWYKTFYQQGKNAAANKTAEQIAQYTDIAKEQKLPWTFH